MCGICGIARSDGELVRAEVVQRMSAQLVHRGPDEDGCLTLPGCGLGFRRLSIIDVDGSHQPLSNERQTVWAVCNGEIYNYRELRDRLVNMGHAFASDGDAETVLHAYEEWGDGFVAHLRGMFAIALWDAERRRLLLARDRLGIKPLFYGEYQGGLVFGSEIKALAASGLLPLDIDWQAIDLYLSLLYIPQPLTAYRGIRKLPPGHVLAYDNGTSRLSRYWTPPSEQPLSKRSDEEEQSERLRDLLSESVRLHLQSDVPVGFFLSGGMDSSVLVAMASEQGAKPPATFSVGFPHRRYSELKYARTVADTFGCDHHELEVTPDAAALLPALVAQFDEPFGDSSAVPTYYVCKAAGADVKVVIGGDGGDELFAGYEWTRRHRFIQSWQRVPSALREAAAGGLRPWRHAKGVGGGVSRFLDDASRPPLEGYSRRVSCITPELKFALYRGELAPYAATDSTGALFQPFFVDDLDPVTAMNRADLHVYLPDDDLCKVDRMTMMHSLEGRIPLLDHKVAEFALSLPMELKLRGVTTKYLLKRAVRNLLPPEILKQRKQGFGIPVADWMRNSLFPDALRLLTSSRSRLRHHMNPDVTARLLQEHRAGAADHGHTLWALLVLELWLKLNATPEAHPGHHAGLKLADF